MRLAFFKSNKVSWRQGIHLKRTKWHSCMMWGWDKIRSGERLEKYADYWVFTICWRHYGVCWHWYPKVMVRTKLLTKGATYG